MCSERAAECWHVDSLHITAFAVGANAVAQHNLVEPVISTAHNATVGDIDMLVGVVVAVVAAAWADSFLGVPAVRVGRLSCVVRGSGWRLAPGRRRFP